ncbi:MAG: tetratricopeptide repeat protein [Candidatus Gastranaerophilaceae bacterium]|jgi:Tfp pilus assembly protein PilF
MSIFKNSVKILIFLFFALIITNSSVFAYVPLAEAKYKQGLDFSEKCNYSMAIMSFEEAVKIDPSLLDAYFNMGVLYEYTNQNDKAVAAFEQLLKNNPTDGETAFKIASIYYKIGNYKKAMGYVTLISPQGPKYNDSQELYKKISQKIKQEEQKQKALLQKAAVVKATAPSIKEIIDNGFVSPTGISKDVAGNLYVANYGDNSIVKITPSGKKSIVAKGKPLSGPIGIAVDKLNNIYVANYDSNEILKINKSGIISVMIKNIKKPYYLYIDNSGILYISEQFTNTVINMKL